MEKKVYKRGTYLISMIIAILILCLFIVILRINSHDYFIASIWLVTFVLQLIQLFYYIKTNYIEIQENKIKIYQALLRKPKICNFEEIVEIIFEKKKIKIELKNGKQIKILKTFLEKNDRVVIENDLKIILESHKNGV